MAGPMVNFASGYKAKILCAKIWAEECQKAVFPSSSFQVKRRKSPSVSIRVADSTVLLLNCAERTLRAKPSLMSLAISKTVKGCSY